MSDTPRVNIVLGKWVGPLAGAGTQQEFTDALKATMKSLIDEAKDMERTLAKITAALGRNLTPANKVKAVEDILANAGGESPKRGGNNE